MHRETLKEQKVRCLVWTGNKLIRPYQCYSITVDLGELGILYTQGYPSQEEKSSLAFKEHTTGNAEEQRRIQKGQVVWVLTALVQVQNNKKKGHNYITEF